MGNVVKLPDDIIETLRLQLTDPVKAQATRQLLREKCKQSLWFFARYALEFPDIDTSLHKGMCERWQKRIHRRFSLWLLPRSHLKTTLFSEAGTLWELVNNPHLRFLIVNAKQENAEDILKNISLYLRTKETFRWLFPEYCLDLAPKEIRRKCKDITDRLDLPCSMRAGAREGSIEVMGVESSLVSKHYDRMQLDDPVNDLNTATKNYRDKVSKWYKDLLQLRHSPAESIVRLVGTRWHFDDLYSRLVNKEISRRKGQAARGEQIKPHFLFYIRKCREEFGGEIRPIWPERFTNEILEEIKDDIGSYKFSCQYENTPVSDEEAFFKVENIQPINRWLIPKNVVNFAAIDLADNESNRGDHTVITVASFDEHSKMYVREVVRGKILPFDAIKHIYRLHKKYRFARIGIETTSFQKTLYREYKRKSAEEGINIPWVEMKRPNVSKQQRILALQPRTERKDFYYEDGIENAEWLIEEMTTCPFGTSDDIMDTIADIEFLYYAAPSAEPVKEFVPTYDSIYGSLDSLDEKENPNSYISHAV